MPTVHHYSSYRQLDPTVKRRWLKQLRSGELVQTTGHLGWRNSKEAGYCCLGVLADKCGLKGKLGTKWINGTALSVAQQVECGRVVRAEGKLPLHSLDMIDLDFQAQELLVSMNDSGSTFDEIADWIEDNL